MLMSSWLSFWVYHSTLTYFLFLLTSTVMQSYADCWKGKQVGSPANRNDPKSNPSSTSQHVGPPIPFQASSLPLLSRPRIGSPKAPSTPPKRKLQPVFTPRSTPLIHKRPPTPTPIFLPPSPSLLVELHPDALTPPPTPIPFSRFSQAPSTPGLSSGSTSCTPIRHQSRLLTPITPTHIRYDERGLPVDYLSPAHPGLSHDRLAQDVSPWSVLSEFQAPHSQKMAPTPMSLTTSIPYRTIYLSAQTLVQPSPEVVYSKPKMLHHISSDGGPISAMKRYLNASREDETISGMSLFLHCPKKRVPHYSMERVRKERKIAMEWKKLSRLSSKSR